MADSTRLTADFTQVLNGLDQLDARLAGTSQGFAKVGDDAKKAGNDVSKAMSGNIAQNQLSALQKLEAEYTVLSKKAADYEAKIKAAGSSTVKAFAEGNLTAVRLEMDALEKEAGQLGATLKTTGDSAASAGTDVEQLGKGSSALSGTLKNQINDFRVFGKSIGEWRGELSAATDALSGGAKGAGVFSGGLRLIGTAIKATGIGLLVTLVAAAITYFTKFQSGIDKVSQVAAGFGAVVNVLASRLVTIGSALVDTYKGLFNLQKALFQVITLDFDGAAKSWEEGMTNFDTATDSAAAAVSGLTKELLAAGQAAAQLEKDRQALRDFVAVLEKRTAQREADANAAKRISDDEKRSFGARASAIVQEGKLKKSIAEDELTAAKERQRIALRDLNLNAASRDDIEKKREAQAAAIEVIKAGDKVQQAVYDTEKGLSEFRTKAAEKRKQQLEKERAELEKLKEDLERLRVAGQEQGLDSDLAAVNKKYDDLIQVSEKGVDTLNKIEKRRALTPEELAQRQEFGDLAIQIEARRLSELITVLSEFNEKEAALEQEQIDKRKALSEKERAAMVDSINAEKQVRDEQLKQGEESAKAFLFRLKEQGASEQEIAKVQAEFDLLIQQARVRAEIDFQEKLLSATDVGDTARIAQLKAGIETLKAQLANINFQIEAPEANKGFSLFSLLGLDPNSPEFEKDKKALEQAVQETVAGFQAIAQARTDAADAAVEAANRELETANERTEKARANLEEELSLQQRGFASDVDTAQKELANAEQAANKKKEIRDAALKDQQRVQKQQILLDSVLQLSSIVTSAANIIKGFSIIPIVGGPLGIAAAALMIAGFIKAKATAFQAVSAQKFRHGGSGFIDDTGFVRGKTHEQGGNRLEIEKGEVFQVGEDGGKRRVSVVRRERVRDYFDLLDAANRNDKKAMAKHALRLAGKEAVGRGDNSKETRTDTVTNSAINTAIPRRESSETGRRERSEIYVRLVEAVERGDVREIEKRMSEIRVSETIRREIVTAIARQDTHGITEKILKEHSVLEAYRTLTESAETRNAPAIARSAMLISGADGITNIRNQYLREAARFVTEKVLISQGASFVQKEFSSDSKTAFARETIERVKSDFAATVERAKEVVGGANFERIIFAPHVPDLKFATPQNQININTQEVARRVFGNGKIDSESQSQSGSDEAKRTNQLLEKMLSVMMQGQRQERWSTDGKTKTKGNITTRYLN